MLILGAHDRHVTVVCPPNTNTNTKTKAKTMSRKLNRCSNCGRVGHNRTLCKWPLVLDYFYFVGNRVVRRERAPAISAEDWEWVQAMAEKMRWDSKLWARNASHQATKRYSTSGIFVSKPSDLELTDTAHRLLSKTLPDIPTCAKDILDHYAKYEACPTIKVSRQDRVKALENEGYYYKDFTGDWRQQRQYYGE